MTPRLAARVVLGLAVLAPWLSLLHVAGALGLGLVMIAVVCSLHGWGALVKRLARIAEAPAALVVHWGLAAMLALAGLAMALHALTQTAQLAIVIAGFGLHGGAMILEWREREARIAELLRAADARYWLVPATGLVLVAGLHVLGAAGDLTSSPFDDDGSLPAQLHRLWDTGTLGDPIGFARDTQLGGHVAASALVTVLGGIAWFRVVDALGFALLVWLALAQLRPRSATASMWAVLLLLVAASYPSVATEAAPRWLAAALLFSLYVTFERYAEPEDDRLLWPLGLVAAAVGTLRSELIPISVAILTSAGIAAIGRSGGGRRILALVGVPLAAVLPYLVVRFAARGTVPSAAIAAVTPGRGGVVPVVMFLGLVIVAIWIGVQCARGPRRWITISTLVGLAGIAVQLTCTRPYATTFVWPIAVSAVLALGLCALRTVALDLRAAGLVLSLLAAVLIYDGRDTPGRVRWSRRYTELASNLQYLRHAYPEPPLRDPYGALLANLPSDALIAVSVARPELLDHAAHRLVDVRGPRTMARRAAVLRALRPAYLLVEDDHLPAERARRDLFYRLACPSGADLPYCADAAWAAGASDVAALGSVRLVRLGP